MTEPMSPADPIREYLEEEVKKLRIIFEVPMKYKEKWARREELTRSVPLGKYLLAIMDGSLDIDVAVMCHSRPIVLNAIMRLPLDMQPAHADAVDVVVMQDGKPVVTRKKPMDCSCGKISQVFAAGHGVTRTPEAQVRKIGRVASRKALNAKLDAYAATEGAGTKGAGVNDTLARMLQIRNWKAKKRKDAKLKT